MTPCKKEFDFNHKENICIIQLIVEWYFRGFRLHNTKNNEGVGASNK